MFKLGLKVRFPFSLTTQIPEDKIHITHKNIGSIRNLIHFSAYPGPPSAPKVISAFKDCITLSWTPPTNTGGTNILGYNLEKRKKGSNLWSLVHPPEEPIKSLLFSLSHYYYFTLTQYHNTFMLWLFIYLLPSAAKKYACKDVIEGMEYEFRVSAVNISGAGEPSTPSEIVFARDPKSNSIHMLSYLTV